MLGPQFQIRSLLGVSIVAMAVSWLAPPLHAQSVQDDYALAAGFYARGQWDEALAGFNELIRAYPETQQTTLARFFAAEALMQRGQFDDGFLAFQSFLKDHPHHKYAPRATFRMGESAYRIDRYEVALRMLEEFVKKNPFHDLAEFALPYLGEMRLKREEPQLSQRAFETALKMYPDSILSNSCRLGLAKALQRQGHDSEAERFYQFLLSQSDAYHSSEASLQMGIMAFGKRELPAAESYLTHALSLGTSSQSSAEATYWLARTHIELDDFERAIALLQSIVIESLPEKLAASVLFDGAIAAQKSERDALALQWLSALRNRYPDNMMVDDALRMEIDIRQKNGESDQALALIREFRDQHQNSPMQMGVLEAEGRSHYSQQRFEKAIEAFDTLIKQHGNDPGVKATDRANWRYLKSLGHLGLGDFRGAEESLNQISTAAQSEALKPLVQIALATASFGREDYSSAVGHYREYLQILPAGAEAARARTELTISLAELNRWSECGVAFDELQTRHPDQLKTMTVVRYLAEKAYQNKQMDLAERWFELMADPSNPKPLVARGLSGLAWVKMETADTRSAYQVFERLLTECPDSKFAGEAAMARAKFLEDSGDYEESSQMYGLVIRRFGESPMASVAKLRRAFSLQKIGGRINLQESKTLLVDYLNQPSNKPLADEALYQLAWLLHDLGQPAEAQGRFVELVNSYPRSKYWSDAAYRIALDAFAKRDFDQSNELIDQLLSLGDTPNVVTVRVLFLKGQIAAAEQRWEEVGESMQRLVQEANDDRLSAKAQYWLAESHYRQKEHSAAVAIFSTLLSKTELLDSGLEPWILLRAAQCYGQLSEWIRATELAREGLDRFAEFESVYEFEFVHGRGLEDQGKLTDARTAYERVVASRSGGNSETAAIAQWRIGETYFHQENYVEAIKAYYKVHSLFSYPHWRSAALIQAGKCQEHLRKNRHAMKLYLDLIKEFPDSEFVDEARQRINQLTRQAILTNQQPKPGVPNNRR